jgi:hypothetical protein
MQTPSIVTNTRDNICSEILYLASQYGNRELRRIFEPKKNKMVGGWRKLLNEELLR